MAAARHGRGSGDGAQGRAVAAQPGKRLGRRVVGAKTLLTQLAWWASALRQARTEVPYPA